MKPGDRLKTWFSDQPDGKSTVVGIWPYTGRYKEDFTHSVELTAPRTRAGTLIMSVNLNKPIEGLEAGL
jgi:hypothetical protein